MEKGPDEAVSPSTELTGRQRTLWEALRERDEGLASMYLGALVTLSNPANPDRLSQTAHSLRELIEKLPRYVSLPELQSHGPLLEKVRSLENAWGTYADVASSHSINAKVDDMDNRLQGFLQACEEFFLWLRQEYPRFKQRATSMLRKFDPRRRPMPEVLETRLFKEWRSLRGFFMGVAHHNTVPTEDHFEDRLEALERFLFHRLRPQAFGDFDELDEIVQEIESRVQP